MDFQSFTHEDQRLVILRVLSEMAGYQANESVLQTLLGQFGHNISRDLVINHLMYLQRHGAVKLESVMGVQVATLTREGEDAASGLIVLPGVKKPSAR